MNRPAYEFVHAPRLEPVAGATEDRTIGRILVDLGTLKQDDVGRIFALHREKGLRFGEAARRLRLVKDEDVQRALSVQFNYPYVNRKQAALGPELVVAHDPFSAQAEAFRDVRTQLLLQWIGPEHKVLAIVSPGPREGRSYVAANLAVAFAQLGEQTLLIDADLRSPRQHRVFGLSGPLGIAHALTGRVGIDAAERVSYFDTLAVLSAGAAPPNPLELLSRPEFPRLVGEARRRFTAIVIDTPSGERGSDVKAVAARADGVLMVARKDRTRMADLESLRQSLANCGAPVIGAIVNAF